MDAKEAAQTALALNIIRALQEYKAVETSIISPLHLFLFHNLTYTSYDVKQTDGLIIRSVIR